MKWGNLPTLEVGGEMRGFLLDVVLYVEGVFSGEVAGEMRGFLCYSCESTHIQASSCVRLCEVGVDC